MASAPSSYFTRFESPVCQIYLYERLSAERLFSLCKATSTNPIASIFAWARGLSYRGTFDETPEVVKFAEDLEKVCVDTVEAGHMTKDLALLIGPDQTWMITQAFLDKLDQNLQKAMG